MKILNFGSVNIDFTYRVPHFVRPGETLAACSVTRNAGGKGFNQSVALAKAGCDVYHAGHIGADGEFLKNLCDHYGIHTDYLTEVDTPTGNAIIQVDDHGANCIILFGGANQAMDIDFIRQVLSKFEKGDMIVLQNEINCMNELITMAHEAGIAIAINPAPMNDAIAHEKLALCNWLILNETEAEELTGVSEPYAQLEALRKDYPTTAVLLTLGVRGCICRKDGKTYTMGSCKVNAVDTTAAGDTFAGFFLGSLSRGKDIDTALLTATRASALAVQKQGAAQSVPTLEEVEACTLIPGEVQL